MKHIQVTTKSGRNIALDEAIIQPFFGGEGMTIDTKVREIIIGIVDKIRKEYQPDRIILFGSYAYGVPDRDSDIDLLIIKDTQDRPIDRRVTVRRIVSDPKRFIPFEPIVLTSGEIEKRLEVGDQFLREIIEKGEVLYAA